MSSVTGTQDLIALIAVAVAMAGGYGTSVYFLVNRIDRRLERIEDRMGSLEGRMTSLEIGQAKIGQQLVDHITNHPGPTERLVH